jgi:hypothetical protein
VPLPRILSVLMVVCVAERADTGHLRETSEIVTLR